MPRYAFRYVGKGERRGFIVLNDDSELKAMIRANNMLGAGESVVESCEIGDDVDVADLLLCDHGELRAKFFGKGAT